MATLIVANGIAFAAETADSVYAAWGPAFDGAMYLIGRGEATVCVVPGRPIKLLEGGSFGEMALLAPA
jgi:hypothetical protein